jgi:hypothetical protein
MENTEKATDHFHPPESPDNWSKEDSERILEGWSHHEQKKLIRRVDLRLIPICGLLYCVSLLDRTNLSNAVIAGMGEELNLTNVNGVDRYVCDPASLESYEKYLQIGRALSRWSSSSLTYCVSRQPQFCAAKSDRESSCQRSLWPGAFL